MAETPCTHNPKAEISTDRWSTAGALADEIKARGAQMMRDLESFCAGYCSLVTMAADLRNILPENGPEALNNARVLLDPYLIELTTRGEMTQRGVAWAAKFRWGGTVSVPGLEGVLQDAAAKVQELRTAATAAQEK
jgi:hypothetical protein